MTSADVLDPSAPLLPGDPAAGGRGLRGAIRDFSHNRMGMVGLAVIVVMLLFSFVGPLLYPTNQTHPNLLLITHPPSAQFPLGTDAVGYNVLGRLMVAGQSTLEVGLAAAAIATIVGTLWGAVAGYVGGWVGSGLMRIVGAVLAVPAV